MTAAEPAGPRYDAALHLLDRQLLDPGGRPEGNVDDLELAEAPDGGLVVTALLTGPGALGPRLGGRLGRCTVRIWQRLRGDAEARPYRIPAAQLAEIGSSVRLTRRHPESQGLELWLQDLIRRLPGAGAAGAPGQPPADARPSADARPMADARPTGDDEPLDAVHRLGELLGAPVCGRDGAVWGHVNDVRLAPAPGAVGGHAPLRVIGVVVGDRHAGSLLGYDRRGDQGPWLVRVVVRRLHRNARYLPWSAVEELDWAAPRVRADRSRGEALG